MASDESYDKEREMGSGRTKECYGTMMKIAGK